MKSLRSDYPLYTRKSYGSAVGSRGGAEKDADRHAIWSPSTKKETHDGGSNRRSAGITEHSWYRFSVCSEPFRRQGFDANARLPTTTPRSRLTPVTTRSSLTPTTTAVQCCAGVSKTWTDAP